MIVNQPPPIPTTPAGPHLPGANDIWGLLRALEDKAATKAFLEQWQVICKSWDAFSKAVAAYEKANNLMSAEQAIRADGEKAKAKQQAATEAIEIAQADAKEIIAEAKTEAARLNAKSKERETAVGLAEQAVAKTQSEIDSLVVVAQADREEAAKLTAKANADFAEAAKRLSKVKARLADLEAA